jgi:hypothetical protein
MSDSIGLNRRHLHIEYHNKRFVFDAAMDGPILGAAYRF